MGDNLYLSRTVCPVNENGTFTDNVESCTLNKINSQKVTEIMSMYSATQEKFTDMQLLYSREMMYTVNLTAGIGFLILYLYYNK